ncbi:MAG: guanylate kinase [Phycisphaerae bacterium]
MSGQAETSGPGRLIVISGPSGVGKSTIVKEVLGRMGLDFSVSATTRARRPAEVDGRDYRFVSREEFERLIQADGLLEWAEVFGNYYGTPAGPVRQAVEAGRTILLDIDVQGAMQVHGKCPAARFILIEPPDEKMLEIRLNGRGTEDDASKARRLAKAREELAKARSSGVYNHYVVNDDLETAIRQVVGIINQESAKR